MKFFIDTANVDEIKQAKAWGIVDGVTTNPSPDRQRRHPAQTARDGDH